MRAMCCYTSACGVIAEQVKQVAFLSDWARRRHPRGYNCMCSFTRRVCVCVCPSLARRVPLLCWCSGGWCRGRVASLQRGCQPLHAPALVVLEHHLDARAARPLSGRDAPSAARCGAGGDAAHLKRRHRLQPVALPAQALRLLVAQVHVAVPQVVHAHARHPGDVRQAVAASGCLCQRMR